MAAPLSLARVYASAKRIHPAGLSSWADDTSQILKELLAIAYTLARSNDQVDAIINEFMPDTTLLLLDRWEALLQTFGRLADTPAVRRARILAVLARQGGYTVAKLATALSGPLATSAANVAIIETLRAQIDAALTLTDSAPGALPQGAGGGTVPFLTRVLGAAWPGNVDDRGVRVYVAFSAPTYAVINLVHEDGTTIAIAAAPGGIPSLWTNGWTEIRSASLLGHSAMGPWTLQVKDYNGNSGASLTSWQLMVSNDVDSQQIYRFFEKRDPALPGVADLFAAQRLVRRTAAGHLKAIICERATMTVDDPHCLCDREPLGV